MRLTPTLVAAVLAASPAAAQGDRTDYSCSTQMLRTVIVDMPPGTQDLDPRKLSCLGLAQVYFIQTSLLDDRDHEIRLRIQAVFRREGLTH